ncbi:hypothetical protein TMFG_01880, partial [Mycobacterium tuberculosis SUMu006]
MAARSAADLHHRRVVDARKPCRAARLRQPVEPVLAQQQPAGAAGSGAAGVGAGAAVA